MPKPRVFISHSANGDEPASKLVQHVYDRLIAEGFDVLLDRKSLEVGDSWEHKIGTWLDRCHAAIILFTKKALESHYVQHEVSILLHRWQQTRGGPGAFPLFPVLLRPLTEPELKGFYATIHLWAVQVLGPAADADVTATLVGKLAPLKQIGLSADPDERLVGHVTALLQKVNDDDFLADVANQIGLDTSSWPAADVASVFADALVSSDMTTAWEAVRLLYPRLLSLTRNLFDFLMPCWVTLASASALDEVTRAPGIRCAAVHAQKTEFTPRMYLARAKAQAKLAGTIVTMRADALGLDVEAGLRARVRDLLEEALDVNDPDLDPPTTIAAELARRKPTQPIIVAVRLDMAALPALAAIAGSPDFAGATFLALTTPLPSAAVPGVTLLQPLLPSELENRAYKQHRDWEKELKDL